MPDVPDRPTSQFPVFKPYVLVTEYKNDLTQIVEGIRGFIQPKNYMEELVVNSIARYTLDEGRCFRIKAGTLNSALKRALFDVLKVTVLPSTSGNLSPENEKRIAALACLALFDEEGRRRIEAMLEENGFDYASVEAIAFSSVADDLLKLDRLIKNASEARERALRSIPRLRKDFPQQIRAASDLALQEMINNKIPDGARPS